jgi:peptidoglycan/xylan/chitin deacetylase (PgdA/CDA1 family)
MNRKPTALLPLLFFCCCSLQIFAQQPTISFTFDDADVHNQPGYKWEVWNQMILQNLKDHSAKAALYVHGSLVDNPNGKKLLESWDKAGHMICNHTYSHANFNTTTVEAYIKDFLKVDSLIRVYPHYTKLFRFPYLKEGETAEKIAAFRAFLKKQGYKNGNVTIDNSDWFISNRLVKRLRENHRVSMDAYRKFYLDHLWDRAQYYDTLAVQVTGRHIHHTILLHHNLTSALFLGDLIRMFKGNGWKVVDASEAYQDAVFNQIPEIVPAGESLIWGLAKQNGKFEGILRYPAEDGKYIEKEMNGLGL